MEVMQEIIHKKSSLFAVSIDDERLGRPDTLNLFQNQTVKHQLELVLIAELTTTFDIIDHVVVITKVRLAWPRLQQVRNSDPVLVHKHAVIDILALFH